MMDSDFNTNIYTPVKKAYLEVQQLRNEISKDDFLRNSTYKGEREKWVASVFMRGIEKLTNRGWCIQMQKDDPPDCRVVSERIMSSDKKTYDEAEIEIIYILQETANKFNKSKFSKEIADFLAKKKFNKQYPKTYIMLVYLNYSVSIDLNLLYKCIKKQNPQLGQIWILSAISPGADRYVIEEIFPGKQRQEIDICRDFE